MQNVCPALPLLYSSRISTATQPADVNSTPNLQIPNSNFHKPISAESTIMGRGFNYKKLIKQWIQDIPDSKLVGGMADGESVYYDKYMRLDSQRNFKGPDGLMYYNLQVQINRECPDSTLKKIAPKSVAICICPVENEWSAAQIKASLIESITGYPS
jgi:hypothetical protein